ncbi:NTP transferase domain-containing protein [Actinopolymorpha rutila]|uniref:Molybdopterin-guanine dinucleotide biosynthesis protein A n=1 Tax=Actinopolymorpha rutila TaxID=446787 RepID=A0A852ZD26_9ACTN|nr:molybdopterin-guanine dinucleotide biosynthesis protein A [Actinopolymorpha rutila]
MTTPPADGQAYDPTANDRAYDVIVLAGGGARRFGGTDKVLLPVGGRPMLDRVLAACAGAASVTVVGPRRAVDPHLPVRPRWTREDPPGSGPLAAVAAGLLGGTAPVVVVLAADMPLVDADVVAELVTGLATWPTPDVEGVTLTDGTGRTQPLAAAYRRTAVDRVLAETGDPRNQPARRLTTHLKCAKLRSPRAARDCDTPDDLAAADQLARTPCDSTERPPMLLDWAQQLTTALAADASDGGETPETPETPETGVSPVVDADLINTVLDLARDAAHNVDRPAAPLTTFLVGYAAARRGGSPADLAACVDLARDLSQRWDTGGGSTDPWSRGGTDGGSAD